MTTLKGLRAKITFESGTSSLEIPLEITSELENIRQIQGEINEIITEKIAELKTENKFVDDDEMEEDEDASDGEE